MADEQESRGHEWIVFYGSWKVRCGEDPRLEIGSPKEKQTPRTIKYDEKEKQNNAKSINNQAAAAIQCESERATVGFWDALCRATITSSGCVCNTTRMSCCFRGTRGDA